MNTLKLMLKVLLALSLLVIGWVWSGIYNVAADVPHSRPVTALLDVLRERSIAVRASGIEVPPLDDDALIRAGAGNYDAMCSGCHLAPGMAETELSRGLYPTPPNLAQTGIADPAAAFWVIKHGVKASGMPAWGRSMEDAHIWGMVALLRALPEMTPQHYRTQVADSEGHSHGGGETGHGPAAGESSPDRQALPDGAASPREGHDDDHAHNHDNHQSTREPQGSAAASGSPRAVAQALHAALAAGAASAVEALLDPQVLILESGGAERSRAEYAAHHMSSDMAFLKNAQYTLVRQGGDSVGDLAWVASEARIESRDGEVSVNLASTETLVLKHGVEGWKVVHVHWSSRPIQKTSNQSEEHDHDR